MLVSQNSSACKSAGITSSNYSGTSDHEEITPDVSKENKNNLKDNESVKFNVGSNSFLVKHNLLPITVISKLTFSFAFFYLLIQPGIDKQHAFCWQKFLDDTTAYVEGFLHNRSIQNYDLGGVPI